MLLLLPHHCPIEVHFLLCRPGWGVLRCSPGATTQIRALASSLHPGGQSPLFTAASPLHGPGHTPTVTQQAGHTTSSTRSPWPRFLILGLPGSAPPLPGEPRLLLLPLLAENLGICIAGHFPEPKPAPWARPCTHSSCSRWPFSCSSVPTADLSTPPHICLAHYCAPGAPHRTCTEEVASID